MKFEETYQRHPAMRLLRRSLGSEERIKAGFASALLISGATFGWVFYQQKNVLTAIGLSAIILAIKLLAEVWRNPGVESDRLWRLLTHHQQEIVWVYTINTQIMPFGFHLWDRGEIKFCLLDGSELTVFLPARKLKMVSKFLNRLLPHATFGYSDERRQQFEQDPALLVRKQSPDYNE
jgi:hypothetical protein